VVTRAARQTPAGARPNRRRAAVLCDRDAAGWLLERAGDRTPRVFCLQGDGLLDDVSHPNDEKYAHQRVFVVAIDDYVYLVPYVETENEIFLKTVIPSRKATRQYFGGDL